MDSVEMKEMKETLDMFLIRRTNDPCRTENIMLIKLDLNIWGDLVEKQQTNQVVSSE